MRRISLRIIRLFIGYFICSTGIMMTINADLGYLPWDVLHQGIGNITGITMGRANMSLGFIVIIVNIVLGEKIGWGTVLNMIFIGIFMDFISINKLIPSFNNFMPSLIMMLLGVLVLGYGSFIYISAGFGGGPRDALMIALTKKTGKSVRLVKNSVEVLVLIIGYTLGGLGGIGTVILSLFGGYAFQFAFKTVGFDVAKVNHRLITDDIDFLKRKFKK